MLIQKNKLIAYYPLYAIVFVCIAPIIAAIYAYYAIDWHSQLNTETTNYGYLIDKPLTMPTQITGVILNDNNSIEQIKQINHINIGINNNYNNTDNKLFNTNILNKKWAYATFDSGVCLEACAKRLFTTRQLKSMTGRERDRLLRVWFVTDDAPINPAISVAHPDLIIVKIHPEQFSFLKINNNDNNLYTLDNSIWIIDPMQRFMMHYTDKHNNPSKMKKDMSKLLYASQGWQR